MNNESLNNIVKVKPAFKLFLLALLIVCYSCASKRNALNTDTIIEANPKLIFLNYNIKKTDGNNKSVQFINKIITDGKLKNNSNKYIKEGVSGDLECHQLDKNSNIIQSVIIKNPLIKDIEYIDETKKFQIRKIHLEHTEFSLRLKLEPNAKYVTINEIPQHNSKVKILLKTKIN